MFNPKEALERIRRSRNEKEEVKSISDDAQPLFSQNQTENNSDFDRRISSLEVMVSRLTEELTNSNEMISKLKRENSSLETQVLKLEYENNQLKSTQVFAEYRRNSHKKLAPHQTLQSDKREDKEPEKEPELPKKISNHPTPEKESYSVEVEEIVQQIKREPIETILHNK